MRWGVPVVLVALGFASAAAAQGAHDALVAKHAAAHGVPESLVRRVIRIESRGNPRAVSKGNYGLMQIRLGTARALGYRGTAQGLLDADTNMTYAVRYLAGAYRAAGCNTNRAIAYYQRGYHRVPKRRCGPEQPSRVEVVGLRSREAMPSQSTEAPNVASRANPAPSGDVLRPRMVRTVAITRSRSETRPARTVAARPSIMMPPLPRARPVQASTVAETGRQAEPQAEPQADATLVVAATQPQTAAPPLPPAKPGPDPSSADAAVQSPDITQVAAREPHAVPLPPHRQPPPVAAAKPKTKTAHASPRRRTRELRKVGDPLNVLGFIKKLVASDTKRTHGRARR